MFNNNPSQTDDFSSPPAILITTVCNADPHRRRSSRFITAGAPHRSSPPALLTQFSLPLISSPVVTAAAHRRASPPLLTVGRHRCSPPVLTPSPLTSLLTAAPTSSAPPATMAKSTSFRFPHPFHSLPHPLSLTFPATRKPPPKNLPNNRPKN